MLMISIFVFAFIFSFVYIFRISGFCLTQYVPPFLPEEKQGAGITVIREEGTFNSVPTEDASLLYFATN